jgi:NADPH-dependent ferric siderophore reductase
MFRLRTVRSERISPGFQRLTVTGDDLHELEVRGHDHWFRMFLRLPGQPELRLPTATGSLWYPQLLAMPHAARPHCANYTVRAHRPATATTPCEIDIDVVVHHDAAGELEGGVAIWACAAQPGDELGILDQGLLFHPPVDATAVHLVAEESGLPAVEGILRSLPREATGTVIQEVAHADDMRPLDAPAGVAVRWLVRTPGEQPGSAALAALREVDAVDPLAYAFVVGEQALAAGGRRHLHGLGLPRNRITFSGFWKA